MAKKVELKTKINDASVEDFLNTVTDEQKRADCFEIIGIMQQITNVAPRMWGANIVGFGTYHYKGASGREGDWYLTGFSPRKQNLSIYIVSGFNSHEDLLKILGKYKTSVGCLFIKKLADVDKSVLKELITESVKITRKLSK